MNIELGRSLSNKSYGNRIGIDLYNRLEEDNSNIVLVGWSGSGKTTTIKSILDQLLEDKAQKVIIVATHTEDYKEYEDRANILIVSDEGLLRGQTLQYIKQCVELNKFSCNTAIVFDTPERSRNELLIKAQTDLIKSSRQKQCIVITSYFEAVDIPIQILMNSSIVGVYVNHIRDIEEETIKSIFDLQKNISTYRQYSKYAYILSVSGHKMICETREEKVKQENKKEREEWY